MRGYVALTTILVLVPLLLLTGTTSMYNNLTSLVISKMSYDSQILKTNSETCLEETVYMLKRNPLFVGDYLITQDTWNCTINITDKVGVTGIKIMNIIAMDENNTQITLNRELNMNTNPFELSNLE